MPKNLGPMMEKNKRVFWEQLEELDAVPDLATVHEKDDMLADKLLESTHL